MNIPELRRKAESGTLGAQSALGICYLEGIDIEVDYKEAFFFLSVAADRGASRAVTNLARMYAEGLGTPQDIFKAIRLFEGVADFEIRAQLQLGRLYSRGVGVPIDSVAARKWYTAVARQDTWVDDPATAAFVGAATLEEIEEARAYLARAS